jgi:molybdopterin-guanine dinucleotide biosynthesis protein A
MVRLVSAAVPADRLVCVTAPGQNLPQLPSAVRIAFDPVAHAGPLAGLATGLAAIEHEADAAFVTGCDMPLLQPAFVARMFEVLADHQIAAPHDGKRWHPLAAVYRTDLRPQIETLLTTGHRSLVALLESCDILRIQTTDLSDVDPGLGSLRACNTQAEYENALQFVQS